jgi:serine/threonine-protein kinase RsbW
MEPDVAVDVDSRTVALTVPARADFLVLARLALSAVCRLTPLEPDEVVDLKLAVTETAAGALGDEPPAEDEGERLSFRFNLGEDRLTIEIEGAVEPRLPADERQLGRAIIEATVDRYEEDGATVRLVKYLTPGD